MDCVERKSRDMMHHSLNLCQALVKKIECSAEADLGRCVCGVGGGGGGGVPRDSCVCLGEDIVPIFSNFTV